MNDIPVLIMMRDLLTWPRAMVKDLRGMNGCGEVVLLDNASTYPPLLDWYDSGADGCTVLKLGENVGNRCAWRKDVIERFVTGRLYAVTDPDLSLSGIPADGLEFLASGIHRGHPEGYLKAGFSLRTDDLPRRPGLIRSHVLGWEEDAFNPKRSRLDGDFFDFAVDTTFAVYLKEDLASMPGGPSYDRSLRAKSPYTARHLPWYVHPRNATEEYLYYARHYGRREPAWATMLLELKEHQWGEF